VGQLAGYDCINGIESSVPSGNVVAGIGQIGGRQCMIVANNFTYKGGAYHPITVKKHVRAQEIALENNLPCVYMVDSADKRRIDEAAEELQALMEEEQLARVPTLVFANKQDLLNAASAEDIMKDLELTHFKDRWIHIEACSAKTGEGLESGIEKLVKQVHPQ